MNEISGLLLTKPLEKVIPSVLFIPGNMCCPTVFNDITVPEGVQSSTIDWAMSPGPWDIETLGKRVANLVLEQELGPTILCGYSAGGVIAILAAIALGSRASGLLISNTGANTKGHGDPNFPQRILDHWGTPELNEPFVSRVFSRPIPPKLQAETEAYYKTLNRDAVYQAAYSLRQMDISSQLSQLKCPVTIAHGVLDTSRTPQHAEQLRQLIPGAKLVWLDGGHTIMVEDREGWQKELNELIGKIRNKVD